MTIKTGKGYPVIIKEGEKFGKLTLLREVGRTGKSNVRTVECKCECGNLKIARYSHLKDGNIRSCGCLGGKNISPEQREIKVKEALINSELILLNNHPPILKPQQLLHLLCKSCDGKSKKRMDTIVREGVVCIPCNLKKRLISDEPVKIERIKSTLSSTSLKFISKVQDKPLMDKHKVNLECSVCKQITKRSFSAIMQNKDDCPCRPTSNFKEFEPSHLYLLTIKDNSGIVGYKYGITYNLNKRLVALNYNNNQNLNLLVSWDYSEGRYARKHEKVFKDLFKPIFTKNTLEDGYTETFDKELISTFLVIQSSQYSHYLGLNND